MCLRVISKTGFNKTVTYGGIHEKFNSIINKCNVNFNLDNYCNVGWYESNSIKYTVDNVLLYETLSDLDIPQFCKVLNIFVNSDDDSECVFFCQLLNVHRYDSHVLAYKVKLIENFDLFFIKDLYITVPFIIYHLNDENYVSLI